MNTITVNSIGTGNGIITFNHTLTATAKDFGAATLPGTLAFRGPPGHLLLAPGYKTLKEQEPRLRTGVLLVGCPADPGGLARAARTDTLVLNYRYVNRALADLAHRQGLKVSVWNIDDPELLESYLDMNLEAICTNRPEEIINYLKRGMVGGGPG